jgi:predicted regulator of Ras-like GTPase activity (Roadblock/LC7/MglB family)
MRATSQSATEAAFSLLASTPGVLGLCLASRDGLPVLVRWAELQDVETFVAMQATALGAAEIAVSKRSAGSKVSVVVQDGGTRHVVVGVDRELFIILWAERSLSIDACLDEIAEFAQRLHG